MKDFQGTELTVGDRIAYVESYGSGSLSLREVTEVGPDYIRTFIVSDGYSAKGGKITNARKIARV